MSLRTQITADATAVFLQTNDFAQSITHYPMGDPSAAETVTANVDFDDEDFNKPDTINQNGERIYRRCLVDLSTSVNVTCSERSNQRDQFAIEDPISGELVAWHAIRLAGRDPMPGMQTVVCHRADTITTKRTRLKP